MSQPCEHIEPEVLVAPPLDAWTACVLSCRGEGSSM